MIGYSKRGEESCVNATLISPECIQGGLRPKPKSLQTSDVHAASLEGMEEEVESEGDDGEGAVRLVRLLLAHRRPPEVVQEH